MTKTLYLAYPLIGYFMYEFYKYYQHCQRLSKIKKIRMSDANNEKMTQLYLKKLLEDEFFFKQLGLCANKETEDLTHYELSMILNTFILGKHKKISNSSQIKYDHIISQLENRYNLKFKKSDDKTFNKVVGLAEYDIYYKPQFIKFAIIGMRQILNLYMTYLDYDIYYDNITHVRFIKNKFNDNTKPYYLFIHGFGIGLIPYIKLLSKLKDFNIIFMEIPNITLTYEFEYYDDKFLIITLENYLRQNKIKSKLNIIAHSYGGFVSQKLYNLNKDLFNKFYLIETPTLISLMPYCCYLFTKKNVSNAPWLHKLLIYTDINVYMQVARNDTSVNQYIHPELYEKIYMFLATNDIIVKHDIAKHEIKNNSIKNFLYEGSHAEFLLNDKILNKIINIIKEDNV